MLVEPSVLATRETVAPDWAWAWDGLEALWIGKGGGLGIEIARNNALEQPNAHEDPDALSPWGTAPDFLGDVPSGIRILTLDDMTELGARTNQISLFVNGKAISNNQNHRWVHVGNGSNAGDLGIRNMAAGEVAFEYTDNPSSRRLTSAHGLGTSVLSDSWLNICGTWDSNTANIYVYKAEEQELISHVVDTQYDGNWAYTNNDGTGFTVGGNGYNYTAQGNRNFRGQIGVVAVWSRALSKAEVDMMSSDPYGPARPAFLTPADVSADSDAFVEKVFRPW